MPGLGTSFGRGGATTAQQDLQNSDAILIMGSSMAENHPVGFQWVMEARRKGAKIIHVDPRFSRTSAMADYWLPLRAGTDIIFLGALINYTLTHDRYFREYVVHYTNAPIILREDFRDTEDLGGIFSGWGSKAGSSAAASPCSFSASLNRSQTGSPARPSGINSPRYWGHFRCVRRAIWRSPRRQC